MHPKHPKIQNLSLIYDQNPIYFLDHQHFLKPLKKMTKATQKRRRQSSRYL